MLKYLRVTVIVAIALFMLSGTANALAGGLDVRLTVDGVTKGYRTSAETVGELMAELGIKPGQYDVLTPAAAAELNDGAEITLKRGFNVVLSIDGKAEVLGVAPGKTAGEVIGRLEKERRAAYVYSGKRDELLVAGAELRLSTIYTEEQELYMPLMFDTELVADAELEKDVEVVVQNGEPGELKTVSRLTFISGQLARTQVMSESLVKEPVKEIIRVGTKPPLPKVETETGPRAYVRVLDMSSTAYSAHYECTGKNPGHPAYGITATGVPVDHGIVAVDPDVIPLGTRLYVEGYGVALAADTGSAIVGNKIDLYHERLEDAKSYGRRTVKVYVLA